MWLVIGLRAGKVNGQYLRQNLEGINGKVGDLDIESELVAEFNMYNLLGAIAVTQAMGIKSEKIEQGIRELKNVPGRLERISNDLGIHVLVDYAHKPDALQKVLETLNQLENRGKIFTVLGCGGNRDRTKRPVMGKIAVEGSDQVIITSDNPRKGKS